MPKARINEVYINKVRRKKSETDVWHYDTKLPALVLVQRSGGALVFYCWSRPGRKRRIGCWPKTTVEDARDVCKQMLTERDEQRRRDPSVSYGIFRKEHFDPAYSLSHRKRTALNELNAFGIGDDEQLNAITEARIRGWMVARQEAGLKPGTINRGLNMLRSMLNWAVREQFLEANPINAIRRLPEPDSKRVRFLSEAELSRLYNALGCDGDPPYLEPMVLLSLFSGVRQNELFRLRWNQVVDGVLRVESYKQSGGELRTRYVPLPPTGRVVVDNWRKESDGEGLLFRSPKTGKQLTNVRKAWASLLDRAQIEDFGWHDMRHHYASSLVMNGVSLYEVQRLLGHSTIEMTMRYAHLDPNQLKKAVEVLG